MNPPLFYRTSIAFKVGALLVLGLCFSSAARGQQELVPELTAPPPMKFLSSGEKAQLSPVSDPKERTRISLELAEAHLRHAEDATFTHSYDPASAALGRYQAIIEDALRFLTGMDTSTKKMRDLIKRLELTLRAHVTRIEAIRRDTPFEYAVNIKSVLDYTRDARTRALDTFFGNTVIRENLQNNEQHSGDHERSKDPNANPQKK